MANVVLKFLWIILPLNISSAQNVLSPSILMEKLAPSIYDKLLAPQKTISNETTVVLADIHIESISSVQTASMDYDIDFYLDLEWYDQRLSLGGTEVLETNDLEIARKFWLPDLYILNSKEANFPSITVPNFYIRVFPEGKINLSQRIRASLSCKMHLEKFPADKQHCGINLLTYMSRTHIVLVRWKNSNLKIVGVHIELPDYKIGKIETYYCLGQYPSGTYSCLNATIELTRYGGYHFFQTYIPSTIVVVISWISFWITPRAVPARVTLGITTFLALSTQFQGVKTKLPAISYATAIDIWTTICTVFVFGALLEFAVSYHFWETENSKSATKDSTVQTDIVWATKTNICHRKHSKEDYDIDMYLRLDWYDQRLSHNGPEFLETNDLEIARKLWWPDLYIVNAKEASFPEITVPNFSIRAYSDGKIMVSRRIRATLYCKMSLENFPADIQVCGIKLLTYMSTTDTVVLRWSDNETITVDPGVELPDYQLGNTCAEECSENYSSTFSCLKASFELKRFSGYHLMQTYIPSTIVVVISWIGFWITPRAVPARVTLSITTFLALSTQFQGVKMKLPAISYITGIDVWTTMCTAFVFAALLEFAISYHLWEEEHRNDKRFENVETLGIWAVRTNLQSGQRIANQSENEQTESRQEKPKCKQMNSSKVDRFSRVFFPLTFLICNVIYWWKYTPNLIY